MSSPPRLHHYTWEDYLALEEASNVKHEFLRGEIYAMAGGTPEHAALAMAVGASLVNQLRGGPCRVYSSDLRVRVLATGLATYPDVTVVCGPLERDPGSATTIVNPTLVVEVLSDSTFEYDRGEKLHHYRQIPSLKAVFFAWHTERRLELHERAGGDRWTVREAGPGQRIAAVVAGCELAVDEIYGDLLREHGS
ncbi:MAG: Uma2 family endonuclease [Candidatus Binatia bacterium]